MASTIKQRFRRYNGADYDVVHLETDGSVVEVQEDFPNPLNTDQLTLGQHDVYFAAYPNIKWCVDHLDGDYVYLGLYNVTETTIFGSNATYSGSTIAQKCTDYLNNTIPNVADYLESVTVNGVTSKVFIPSYKMMFGRASGMGDIDDPTFDYPSASNANRAACVSNWSDISNNLWLSSPYGSLSAVFFVAESGRSDYTYPSYSYGFRPEVKVRYKETPITKDLNTAIDDIGAEIHTLISKQDALTFDTTPTANSTNPVTSSGVKSFVDDSIQGIDGADINVELPCKVSILNTDSPVLGDKTVYFKAYPDIKWCVDHIEGDYVYLGLYNATETTTFGSNTTYSGSTIASKCATYLNNTIPNVADYLEEVTVHGVTSKVFIPSKKMFSGTASSGGVDANDPTFDYPSASTDNRKACIANWSSFSYFWLSSPFNSGSIYGVCTADSIGGIGFSTSPSNSYGFRPEVKVRYKETKVLNTALKDIDTEIDTLKTSVSDGKAAVASAITDKGVSTASDASFSTMATNIGSIQTGPDVSSDTVTADKMLSGTTAHDAGGNAITGTIPNVTHPNPSASINSSTGVVTASHVQGTGYVTGGTTTGTLNLTTQAAKTVTPGTSNKTAVAAGRYTTGAVTVAGDANLTAANIKSGTSIFGVTGSYIASPNMTNLYATGINSEDTHYDFTAKAGAVAYCYYHVGSGYHSLTLAIGSTYITLNGTGGVGYAYVICTSATSVYYRVSWTPSGGQSSSGTITISSGATIMFSSSKYSIYCAVFAPT